MESDYQISEGYQENRRVIGDSFIRRHFPILVVVVFSIFSLGTMSYFVLGMRGWPTVGQNKIERVQPVERNLSYQELVEQDKGRIQGAVNNLFGPGESIYVSQYSPSDVEKMKFQHKELGSSRGNLFVQIKDTYYYLSPDGNRLYFVRLSRQNQKPLVPKSNSKDSGRTQVIIEREEIYKDKDGVWRNKKYVVPCDINNASPKGCPK